jgi:lactoylglutathione lyase
MNKTHAENAMIKQLAHINFYTDRSKDMIDFYIDKLEMKIKFTLDDHQGKAFGWYVDCGQNTFIEIFDQVAAIQFWGGQVTELNQGNQYRHLCFEVNELADFTRRLAAKGVEVTPITVGMDHSNQTWIHDPDGNAIELMEYTPESLQIRKS